MSDSPVKINIDTLTPIPHTYYDLGRHASFVWQVPTELLTAKMNHSVDSIIAIDVFGLGIVRGKIVIQQKNEDGTEIYFKVQKILD